MERFIGLDAHLSSCVFGVVGPSGRRLRSEIVETSEEALVRYLRSIPGQRYLCMEEGTMSEWLFEVLSPHVQDIVVVNPKKKPGNKTDVQDAFDLAEMRRVGNIETNVFKGQGRFRTLRELARVYSKVVTDVVRVQNRIKSLYRSRGIDASGQEIYSSKHRIEWLEKLPHSCRQAATTYFDQYDAMVAVKEYAYADLVEESSRHRITKILQTCPGMGPIRVAQSVAIVVTPLRFRTKRPFWSYCGLGVVMRVSSQWRQHKGVWVKGKQPKTRGLNPRCNHLMKDIFKGAATTVITNMRKSPLGLNYDRMLSEGVNPTRAKLSTARKIAAIYLAMWKNEEEYNPNYERA